MFFINIPVGILSLILSNRMVTDPPHLRDAKERARRASVDWVGLGLVATGLGCAEVVLDKGQEDDWFNSSFIVGFAIVAVVSLVSFVFWELQHENPIVDLRMFNRRSFAVANGLMVVLGVSSSARRCSCRSTCKSSWATQRSSRAWRSPLAGS